MSFWLPQSPSEPVSVSNIWITGTHCHHAFNRQITTKFEFWVSNAGLQEYLNTRSTSPRPPPGSHPRHHVAPDWHQIHSISWLELHAHTTTLVPLENSSIVFLPCRLKHHSFPHRTRRVGLRSMAFLHDCKTNAPLSSRAVQPGMLQSQETVTEPSLRRL